MFSNSTSDWRSAAPVGGRRRESGNLGLVFGSRIFLRRGAAPVLQEGNPTEAGFGVVEILAPAAHALAGGMAVGVAGWRASLLAPTGLSRLLWILILLTTLFVAITDVIALTETTHGLDHPEIVVGVLPIGLGLDAIPRSLRLPGKSLIFVEYLMSIAANPDIGTAAVEHLVSIGRAIGIVMLLLVVVVVATATSATTAAATIATAARSLTIVWSH